ncbi:putative HMG box protein [Blattamonas nauphoetae]|uniref:HMG box protein n=1 Tax=Blattamonas nauphoetae TaxID=2049346 RepID=A0ABQ9WZV6_9EUKA|nr:putative HMG box protein [Blattamonas nauphoetae]
MDIDEFASPELIQFPESPSLPQSFPTVPSMNLTQLSATLPRVLNTDRAGSPLNPLHTPHKSNPITCFPGTDALRTPSSFSTPKSQSSPLMSHHIPQSPRFYSQRKFTLKRSELANTVYAIVNEKVFRNHLPPARIFWSKTLRKTAGLASIKKEVTTKDGVQTVRVKESTIELSSKIVDNFDRLVKTLTHEMCHLAQWYISGDFGGKPHGKTFKKWGRQCYLILRIEVTTYHHYEIQYKYQWVCTGCRHIYGRHSDSINPQNVRCGVCAGKLTRWTVRGQRVDPTNPTVQTPTKPRQPNKFMEFVAGRREEFKRAHPGISGKDMMIALGAEFQKQKNTPIANKQ